MRLGIDRFQTCAHSYVLALLLMLGGAWSKATHQLEMHSLAFVRRVKPHFKIVADLTNYSHISYICVAC